MNTDSQRMQQGQSQPFGSILTGMPSFLATPEQVKYLVTLCQDIDGLGRIDEQNVVYIHEESYRKLLERGLSSTVADQWITHLKALPNSMVISDTNAATKAHGKLRNINWFDLASHTTGLEPAPDATFEGLGLNASSTEEDFRKALKRRFPQLSDSAFDRANFEPLLQAVSNPPTLGRQIEVQFEDAWVPSVVNCILRHWPWWVGWIFLCAILAAVALVFIGWGVAVAFIAWGLVSIIAVAEVCCSNPNY